LRVAEEGEEDNVKLSLRDRAVGFVDFLVLGDLA